MCAKGRAAGRTRGEKTRVPAGGGRPADAKLFRRSGRPEAEGRLHVGTLSFADTGVSSVRVPVLGSVSCGLPKFAEENIEEYVRLPSSLFGDGEFYFLRAKGDSMIGAGIDDGDLVLIRRQDTARPGQIAVALTDDEATLKRFYPEPQNRRIRLHPENPELEDIYVENCAVQGIAVKVIKNL